MNAWHLSTGERGIVLAALQDKIVQYSTYVEDCERLTERPFPTDNPEMWRKKLAEVEAVYERLSSNDGSK